MIIAHPVPGYKDANDYNAPRSGGRRHKGVDIIAPPGTLIVAASPGIVSPRTSGGLYPRLRALRVDGDDGDFYFYNHVDADTILVHGYQYVRAGQPLCRVGNPREVGYVFPAHLHFSVNEGRSGSYDPHPALQQASIIPEMIPKENTKVDYIILAPQGQEKLSQPGWEGKRPSILCIKDSGRFVGWQLTPEAAAKALNQGIERKFVSAKWLDLYAILPAN